ncbi:MULTISPECIES: DUF1622 domain-containing protein [unclassified Clostridium]|mgnify:FL=1|uniref:DUF1622 domain-containing protein n=1 Tax=Clostridium TaxID=1485 RepID=UPI0021AB4E6F|nr:MULTISPECIES: DUF1622 domain-containing protein [unclassified Clostridium]MDU2289333.1 DUF1622 domain-containing protein [Clostridium celatum]MDU4325968.1 DUF1622 domain-containing protein [Clostridium celatum]
MEELFNKYLPILIHLFELMGILILTLGVFTAFYHYIQKRFFKKDVNIKYEFADVMITTLDFKLAAEILKTVTIKSMDELVILASVFIIRIIMTFVLEKEMKIEKKKEDTSH